MQDKLREYIDTIFEKAPATRRTVELKEEMLQNLNDKYNDLLAGGKNEEAAYNIAVASVGDIDELLACLKVKDGVPEAVKQAEKRRNALFTSVAVTLYVLCPIPLFLIQDEMGLIWTIVIAAIATGLIVFNSMTRTTYKREDDTVVEEFKEWKQQTGRSRQAFKSISGALWLLIVVIYAIVSFATGAWFITWVIFLIGAAVESIIKAVFDLRGQ